MKRPLLVLVAMLLMSLPATAQDMLHEQCGPLYDKHFVPPLSQWHRLAKQGDPVAQYCLGVVYDDGLDGVTEDSEEAARWYGLAAQNGNPDAQFILGMKYVGGDGVPADKVQALKWLYLSSALGGPGFKVAKLAGARVERQLRTDGKEADIVSARHLMRQWMDQHGR